VVARHGFDYSLELGSVNGTGLAKLGRYLKLVQNVGHDLYMFVSSFNLLFSKGTPLGILHLFGTLWQIQEDVMLRKGGWI
jgi:hypothetical protein